MNFIKKIVKEWLLPFKVYLLLLAVRDGIRRRLSEHKELLETNVRIKNRHKGQRCFILGTGSSVKKQDLKLLVGENVISLSNSFVHPDYGLVKPQYHVLPPLIKDHPMFDKSEFVSWLKIMEKQTLEAEMFFHVGDKNLIDEAGLFKNRTIHWNEYCSWDPSQNVKEIDLAMIPAIWSVSEYAICVAIYLGFEEIYLLGIDHDWFNGPLIHFYEEKEHVIQPRKEQYAFVDSEFQMRRFVRIFQKYKYLYNLHGKIFNANADPRSYVDVFPRVAFLELMKR